MQTRNQLPQKKEVSKARSLGQIARWQKAKQKKMNHDGPVAKQSVQLEYEHVHLQDNVSVNEQGDPIKEHKMQSQARTHLNSDFLVYKHLNLNNQLCIYPYLLNSWCTNVCTGSSEMDALCAQQAHLQGGNLQTYHNDRDKEEIQDRHDEQVVSDSAQFVAQRAKERMKFSQRRRRIRELEQRPKTEPSPSSATARSLGQKARWQKAREKKNCQQEALKLNQGVPMEIEQVQQQGNASESNNGDRREEHSMQTQKQATKRKGKTPTQSQDGHRLKKRKTAQPPMLCVESTNPDIEAACGDQLNSPEMESNVHIGPTSAQSSTTENEMSVPAPDVSSDEYTDHYYSSDDTLDDENNDVLAHFSNVSINIGNKRKSGRKARSTVNEDGRNYLGKMDVPCPFCGALHWIDEKLSESSFKNPEFGTCCHKGKIQLPPLREPPPELMELFEGNSYRSRRFRQWIRKYNAANAFTSLGCNYDTRASKGSGPPCFSIHGELRHYSGSLLPKEIGDAIYSQLILYDPAHALSIRENRNKDLDREILGIIQDTLLKHNRFIPLYRQAHDILKDRQASSDKTVKVSLHFNENSDQRRYNLPTVEEVSVIVPENPGDVTTTRDILLHLKDGNGLTRIDECHPAYLPLHYVLFFPYGELGWSIELAQWDVGEKKYTGTRISHMQYFSYRLFQRRSEYSTILRGGKLFQEFLVDAWASTEQNRLDYVRFHQGKLRADHYGSIIKMKEDGLMPNKGGTPCVLPSSHIGSPRHMYEIYQDSMAITRFNHHPDFFLTMTANPKWPEIQEALLEHQHACDRPDIVARVFELKRKALMEEITKKGVFGEVVAHVHTIEFQKRGLPHMHLLIFLEKSQKIRTVEQVDKYVSAEFPDENEDPILFDTVRKCMVHGPCGERNPESPCMRKGKCTKNYPKKYNDTTCLDSGGYPVYRRRDDGREVTVRNGRKAYNTDVVPYNPHLSRMFNCHINVEVCAGVRAVKYINKYIYKGYDKTTVVVGAKDEVQMYIDARYIGPPEGAWRLFGHSMHKEEPNVVRLAIHLPGKQRIIYESEGTIEGVTDKAENYKSTLMAYFEYYTENPTAPAYTYQEFPQHFVWSEKKWKTRQRGFAIARMYFVSPNAGELYYLRSLLTVVAGADSFDSLKTVNGELCPTFKKACIELGLLEHDGEWLALLEEAADIQTGSQLRKLFKIVLSDCNPTEPEILWAKFGHKICDDLPHRLRTMFGIQNPTDEQAMDYGLYLLDRLLREGGKKLKHFSNMPRPKENWGRVVGNRLIYEHRKLQFEIQQPELRRNIESLNPEQLSAYNKITESVQQRDGHTFFLNGSAGTEKTFVYNTVAASCRFNGDVVLTVASSGIASLLLVGGRTAHSTFKIPIEINETSVCSIRKQSKEAAFLKEVKLIIWDEMPMQHRYCVESVNKLMQDVCENDLRFGGVTVVMGGDFRQTLPVIPNGGRADVVGACVRSSILWSDIIVLTLTKNMRLDRCNPENITFAEFLLEVGSKAEEKVQLPSSVHRCKDMKELISKLYPSLGTSNQVSPEELTERIILSARNDDVNDINMEALNILDGETFTYLAADRLNPDESGIIPNYSSEFLQNLNPPGMPLFRLNLKIGCPIILMRNLSPSEGLCNGTRLLVTKCGRHVLQAKILTGHKAGETVLLPRISFQPSVSELNINMTRRQFPVRVAYAMTINKSQGQSVKYVGIDLKTPVFSHGQLYVALSRCTAANRITVLLEDKTEELETTNIVFPEVLL